MCGFAGYIVNYIVPTDSSYVYLGILGPIIIIFGLIVAIVGGAIGSKNPTKKKKPKDKFF